MCICVIYQINLISYVSSYKHPCIFQPCVTLFMGECRIVVLIFLVFTSMENMCNLSQKLENKRKSTLRFELISICHRFLQNADCDVEILGYCQSCLCCIAFFFYSNMLWFFSHFLSGIFCRCFLCGYHGTYIKHFISLTIHFKLITTSVAYKISTVLQ